MKLHIIKPCLFAAALLGFSIASKADLTLGVDFTGGWISSGPSYGVGKFIYTMGYDFQVTTPVSVVALSALDTYTASGLPQSVPVGLWNASGTLLTSATIAQGTKPTLGAANLFADAAITPITLQPGDYTVAALDEWVQGGLTDFTVAPGIKYLGYAQYLNNVFAYPNSHGKDADSLFGGNIVLGPVAAPEPSQWAAGVMLLGCSSLVFAGRRLFKNRPAPRSPQSFC